MGGRLVVLLFLVALLQPPTFAARVSVEYDRTVDFAEFITYSLRPGTPARRPEVQSRIENFVERELEDRGLLRVKDAPDLVVRIYVLVDELTLEQLADETTWKFYTGVTDMDAFSVKAGTLVVDLMDGDGGRRIWRGLIAAPVRGSVDSVERKLDKAVRKLFRKLPR